MNLEKSQPGKQGQWNINPRTGLHDNTDGDHSLKGFIKMQWDWSLIWLLFFTISVLQLTHLSTVIGWVTEAAYADGFFAGLMVAVGMLIWLPGVIGITAFLRDWWLKLCGEKSWNKRIVDKKD